jgi:hypothetical protein
MARFLSCARGVGRVLAVGILTPFHPFAGVALAADTDVKAAAPIAPIAGHPVFELRAGVDPDTFGADHAPHPTLCAEVSPLDRLSVEACGNGSGFLHHDDAPDTAHFRVRYAPVRVRRGPGEASLVFGAGFAEVQSGADDPGFRFGRATTPDQREAAGGELSAAVKGRLWPTPRAYVTAEIGGGAAFVPAAPVVLDLPEPLVGFFAVTLGAGF